VLVDAGEQVDGRLNGLVHRCLLGWVPAFAGMTKVGDSDRLLGLVSTWSLLVIPAKAGTQRCKTIN
jgi:hypothetical protein